MEDQAKRFETDSGGGSLREVNAWLLSVTLSDVPYLIPGYFSGVVPLLLANEFALEHVFSLRYFRVGYPDKDLEVLQAAQSLRCASYPVLMFR